LRLLSAIVLLVVAAIAVAGWVVTRQVVADQERKLLKQRADEAGLYLSSVVGSVQTELASLTSTAAATHESPDAFRRSTKLLTSLPSGFGSIALVRVGAVATVVASSGAPFTEGFGTARTQAVQEAAAKTGLTGALVGTPLFDGVGGARKLGFAYSSPALPGYAVYAESEVRPSVATPTTSSQPFSELIAAVYAVPSVDSGQLVAVTGKQRLPLRGQVATSRAPIGQGQPWLLVAKARHPLVGSVATAMPWALLGAGLLAALLATAVVETLARRREYAYGVADLRTVELKQSLTDLASAHDQLVRSERLAAIGQLASTIGHELRNPLGVISNAVYLIRGDLGPTPTEAAERHVATAEREVSAATVIVSDLLEFARQRDPVLAEVDLVALVNEAVAVLPPPSGIALVRDDAITSVPVLADRDMLRQVLLNLLGNAYQAMPDGGSARVEVGTDNGNVHITVADDGVGMTDEVRDRLFEPFFTTKARGVGLGLAVSKRIVDVHHGEIAVSSTLGGGSQFVVTLPRITLPRQSTATSDTGAGARR
jgi:signal transduction histidine kinase